ncbi:PAS domain S-box protein [Leptolyngbya sp. FACHB-261]|uniref:PAS domain S-box protein n=1 Tax=Leptolyngbya sp. FACHB-261 TaxID=2692806 RepID=UPI001687BC7E|nr:PAS domain S-box protein [Leptolyngbya sp. FACHB-261]
MSLVLAATVATTSLFLTVVLSSWTTVGRLWPELLLWLLLLAWLATVYHLCQQLQRERALNRLAQALQGITDLDMLLRQAIHIVQESLGAHWVWVDLLSEDGSHFQPHAAAGKADKLSRSSKESSWDVPLLVEQLRRGQVVTVLANQVLASQVLGDQQFPVRCEAGQRFNPLSFRTLHAPLLLDQTLVGVLGLVTPNWPWTPGPQAFLLSLAKQLAMAIQQVQLHQKLRDSEALRQIVEQSALGIAVASPQGQFLQVNQSSCNLLGYTETELLSRDFQSISHPEDLSSDLTLVQQLLNGELNSYQLEKRYCRKDGSLLWANLTVSLVRSEQGEPLYLLGQIEDISWRKRSEQELLQANAQLAQQVERQTAELIASQAQMQAILDHVPAFVHLDDLEGQMLLSNAEWRRLFGSHYAAPVGQVLQDVFGPEQIAVFLHENQTVAAQGKAMSFEAEIATPEGLRTYLKLKFPLRDAANGIRAIGCIAMDITERKQNEERLQALTEQLQQQNEQLAEVSQLKSEFLTTMSHELRTPLTSILGFSSVLLQQIFGPLSLKQQEYLSLVHLSGEHLLDLINDLLDLAKIEAGKMALNLEVVDLESLCHDVIQMIEVRVVEKGQHLHLELPESREQVVIDRQRVVQILLNYLSNAVKFTPEGGRIVLRAGWSTCPESIAQALPRPNLSSEIVAEPSGEERFLVLSVSDTGIGVPPDKQHLLFQSFQQVNGAIDRHYEGTGLGLALTRRLAELHGGTVSVASAPGVGSTFSAWLPLLEPPLLPLLAQGSEEAAHTRQ